MPLTNAAPAARGEPRTRQRDARAAAQQPGVQLCKPQRIRPQPWRLLRLLLPRCPPLLLLLVLLSLLLLQLLSRLRLLLRMLLPLRLSLLRAHQQLPPRVKQRGVAQAALHQAQRGHAVVHARRLVQGAPKVDQVDLQAGAVHVVQQVADDGGVTLDGALARALRLEIGDTVRHVGFHRTPPRPSDA